MPHPKKALLKPKTTPFSKLIKSVDAPALTSPIESENEGERKKKQRFSPGVAMYTLAFVSVLVGGLYIGVKSNDFMDMRERRKQYDAMSFDAKLQEYSLLYVLLTCSLQKLRQSLLEKKARLEEQIAVIRVQQEYEEHNKRSKPSSLR